MKKTGIRRSARILHCRSAAPFLVALPRIVMTRFSLLVLLLAAACDPVDPVAAPTDAAEPSDDTAADTADTAAAGASAVLSGDDTQIYNTLWAAAVLSGVVTAEGASGTIAYAENLNEGPDTCTANLSFSTVDSAPNCEGCEWGQRIVATPTSSTGACTYAVPDAAFLGNNEQEVFFAWYEDFTDEWGSHYDELLSLETRTDTSHSMSSIYLKDGRDVYGEDAYDKATGALEFSAGNYGVGIPALWEECDGWEWTESAAAHLDSPQSGTLACPFDEVADVWSVKATAGQVIKASVDTASRRNSMELRLVTPDGCAKLIAESGLRCSGGGDCGSFEYTATVAGTYEVVVAPSWCVDESVDYTLGVTVD